MDSVPLNDSSNWEAIGQHFDRLRSTAKYPVFLLMGQAGTGKSHVLNNLIESDSKFAQLAATTGIAAVNINATTVHRILGFRDVDTIADSYQSGLVQRRLRLVRKYYRFLVIDEAFMLHYKVLDNILWALDEINQDVEDDERLGLILVGDPGQLPPIPEDLKDRKGKKIPTKTPGKFVKEPTPWIFKSELWSRFEQPGHIIKLEKIYRQNDKTFLDGVNAIRRGLGRTGVSCLIAAGVEFVRELDSYFEGTTIVGTNPEVDRINKSRLRDLPPPIYSIPSTRWWLGDNTGTPQPNGWNTLPDVLELKIDAYVMLLANNKDPLTGEMIWANGDCGWVREVIETRVPVYGESTYFDPNKPEVDHRPIIGESVTYAVKVELVRDSGNTVTVPMLTRMAESRQPPEDDLRSHPKFPQQKVRNSMGRLVWCLGEITFMPMRLAYASTVHKVQGTTLDRIQINPRDYFFKNPGMVYVATTRGRTPEGIKIVGDSELVASKVVVAEEIRRFL